MQEWRKKREGKTGIGNPGVLVYRVSDDTFLKEIDVDQLEKDNLCEILSIKPSDLLNESMLKKLKARV